MSEEQCTLCPKKHYSNGHCYRFSVKKIEDVQYCSLVGHTTKPGSPTYLAIYSNDTKESK